MQSVDPHEKASTVPGPARPRSWRRRVRFAALCLLGAVLALMLAIQAVKWHMDRHFYDDYDPDLPCELRIRARETRPAYRRIDFTFVGVKNTSVPALLALPRLERPPPYPCIVFLHGIGQKKEFLDVIASRFTERGFAMTCFDQYTRGERRLPRDTPYAEQARAFRRRAALTVIETRRLVDSLRDRDDIDPRRFYLVGASYGAITGAVAAAFDSRFRAVVLCYGGGSFRKLLPSREARRVLGAAAVPVAWLGAWWLAPADPVRYVGRIAPRPILFQNGRHDGLIPTEAARALYDAARLPKSITWYDSDHVGLDREHTVRVLQEVARWLLEQDAPFRQ
ncbi:MAG: alpha/beta fold hydrolase [Kiritimatiellaeota bacterium]|nr:alpha/beta fold hydrolase [Kiritimatiellota bacterium]